MTRLGPAQADEEYSRMYAHMLLAVLATTQLPGAYTHPLIEGGRVTFLVEARNGVTPMLLGDFNGWGRPGKGLWKLQVLAFSQALHRARAVGRSPVQIGCSVTVRGRCDWGLSRGGGPGALLATL